MNIKNVLVNNLIRGKGGLIMGIMHTKAERTEKVKEIKAEKEKKVKEVRAKKKELDAEVKKKAKQVAAERKKRRAGITFRLVMLAIVPVIVMVLGLIATTVFSLKSGLEEEAMDGLELLGGAVQSSYEDIKGNYEYKNGKLFKGGEELTIKPAALDIYVKNSKNDVQVTLTYGTKRVLTTLTDNKGARLTGTDIPSDVWDVVKTGKTYRDTNYKVDGKRYCAVYVPLKDNNQVVGCVFAGEPTSEITSYIMQKVGTMLIVSVVVLILVGIVATFIAQSISKPIKRASVSVTKVAGGDLTVEVDKTVLKRQDEIGDMGRALETLIFKLREIVGSLAKSATDLGESGNSIDSMASQSSVAAGEISTAVEEISKGAVSQAEEIETATNEIMTMGEQITQIVNNIADLTKTSKNMEEAENASQDTMIELSDAVQRTTDAVARIAKQIETTNESVDKIGNAASLIADIASQTSLLSLNASIESARAGEAGKGFAVVASEIQKLSSQSDNTASKIQEIITDLQNDSKETLEVMRSTEVLVREQYEKLAATKERFKEVGNGINVSKRGTDVIKGNAEVCDSSRVTVVDVISNLSAISEENAASTQQTTSSMQELNATINILAETAAKVKEVSDQLNEDMKYFKM